MKKSVMFSKIILVAGLLLFTLTSCKNKPKTEVPTIVQNTEGVLEEDAVENDATYLESAVAIAMFEMEIGKLALKKGTSEKVKSYGKMLVDDNLKSMEEAKAISNKITVTMPDGNAEMNNESLDSLKEVSGAAFDKMFVEVILREQEKAMDKMTEISQKAKDTDLKLWASRQVIGLTGHYEQAKEIQ